MDSEHTRQSGEEIHRGFDIELPNNYSITVTGKRRSWSRWIACSSRCCSPSLVYMVLASQYESLLHPFTILLTVPFGLVGRHDLPDNGHP